MPWKGVNSQVKNYLWFLTSELLTHILIIFSLILKIIKWGCFILYVKAKFLKFILACNLNFYLKISFFYMWFKMTLLFSSLHKNVKMFCVTLKWFWMKQKYLQYANVDFMMLQILLSVIQMLVYIWLQLLLLKFILAWVTDIELMRWGHTNVECTHL